MFCELARLEEIVKTEYGAVYQCGRQNCYWLDFAGQWTAFAVRDFLSFKQQVADVDLDAMLMDGSRSADFVVLMPQGCQRCFLLSASEVIRLRELLEEAYFSMQLNSFLRECFLRSKILA
jgi:hypothetical protein